LIQTAAKECPTMKSMAAYYAFIAMNSQEQDADRRRAQQKAARPARPSLLARIRARVVPARSTRHAANPA
jgi:hypothetical protein